MFRTRPKPLAEVATDEVRGSVHFIGRVAATLIHRGEILRWDKVLKRNNNAKSMSDAIPPGYRAIAIQVNESTSVDGWTLPGTFVDVVWVSKSLRTPSAGIIVHNAKVLSAERDMTLQREREYCVTINASARHATNNIIPRPKSALRSVALLVTINDAQKIYLGTETGRLGLLLRGDWEEEELKPEKPNLIEISDLLDKIYQSVATEE